MIAGVPCVADSAVILSLGGGTPDGASPSLPVRWCLDRESAEFLVAHNVLKPYLLIVICRKNTSEHGPPYKEVDRVLLPLRTMMGWIQFHRPGPHTLLPAIVWEKDGRWSVYAMHSGYGDWKRRIFDAMEGKLFFHVSEYQTCCCAGGRYDRIGEGDGAKIEYVLGEPICDPRLMHRAISGKPVDVVIDEHFFAPDPPEWEKRWVNLVLDEVVGKSPDQCSFRRRRVFAYTIQPPLVAAFVLIRGITGALVALWYGLFAIRGVRLAPIFHPFTMEIRDVCDKINCSEMIDSAFIVGQRKLLCKNPAAHPKMKDHPTYCFRDYQTRKFWFLWLPLLPIFFVITAIIGALFFNFNTHGKEVPAYAAVLLTAAAPFALSATVGILIFVVWLCAGVVGAVIAVSGFVSAPIGRLLEKRRLALVTAKASRPSRAELREEREQLFRKKAKQELEPIICTGAPLRVEVAALPEDRQTLYLKFSAFKAKICKPFRK